MLKLNCLRYHWIWYVLWVGNSSAVSWENIQNIMLPPYRSMSSSADSFWSDPTGYEVFSASDWLPGCFLWPIRPPTRATNILIFSSSWVNSPSRVMRFGCIFRCGSKKGSRRRCSCRSWSRRRCLCCRRLSNSTRRSRSCWYLYAVVSPRRLKGKKAAIDWHLERSCSLVDGYPSSVVNFDIFLKVCGQKVLANMFGCTLAIGKPTSYLIGPPFFQHPSHMIPSHQHLGRQWTSKGLRSAARRGGWPEMNRRCGYVALMSHSLHKVSTKSIGIRTQQKKILS